MGNLINSEGHEFCPFVTADGRFFFYSSRKDICWVDARILDRYRSEQVFRQELAPTAR